MAASLVLLFASTALHLPRPPALARASPSPLYDRRHLLLAAAVTSTLPPLAAVAGEPLLFTPPPDSLSSATILITGANTGLGLESAKRLAAGGARVVVTARSREKAGRAAREVAVSAPRGAAVVGIPLDLASLQSVEGFPSRLEAALGAGAAVDVLLNNAGVMAIPERLETSDGFERTVGVNHLGHYALVAALLPALRRAPSGFRVIHVSSEAHRLASADALRAALRADLDPPYAPWGNYALSKAANVLFTLELRRRIEAAGLAGSAVALHPGLVGTDLSRYIVGGVGAADVRLSETTPPPTGLGKAFKENLLDKVVLPVSRGANTQVYLAAAADTGGDRKSSGGLYFDDMKPSKPSAAAMNAELASQLWEVSEKLTGAKIAL